MNFPLCLLVFLSEFCAHTCLTLCHALRCFYRLYYHKLVQFLSLQCLDRRKNKVRNCSFSFNYHPFFSQAAIWACNGSFGYGFHLKSTWPLLVWKASILLVTFGIFLSLCGIWSICTSCLKLWKFIRLCSLAIYFNILTMFWPCLHWVGKAFNLAEEIGKDCFWEVCPDCCLSTFPLYALFYRFVSSVLISLMLHSF